MLMHVHVALQVRQHAATTHEVRALCTDLQVLGRTEFKALLKWRLTLQKALAKELRQVLACVRVCMRVLFLVYTYTYIYTYMNVWFVT
jgi:hypothetical protein